MSIRRESFLCCDGCGEEFDASAPRASAVRLKAIRYGWAVGLPGGRDICLTCRRLAQSEATAKIVGNLATVADEVFLSAAPCEYCGDRLDNHSPLELKSCALDLESRVES